MITPSQRGSSLRSRSSSPSGVTYSTAVTPAAATPWRRASQPMPSPEHRADDARLAVEPAGGGEAEERGGVGEVRPAGAGLDASAVGAGVDLDAGQAGGPQQHGVAERAEARGAMTTALGDDAQAAPARLADGRDDAVLVGRDGDGGGALVDGEVERAPGVDPSPGPRARGSRGSGRSRCPPCR